MKNIKQWSFLFYIHPQTNVITDCPAHELARLVFVFGFISSITDCLFIYSIWTEEREIGISEHIVYCDIETFFFWSFQGPAFWSGTKYTTAVDYLYWKTIYASTH